MVIAGIERTFPTSVPRNNSQSFARLEEFSRTARFIQTTFMPQISAIPPPRAGTAGDGSSRALRESLFGLFSPYAGTRNLFPDRTIRGAMESCILSPLELAGLSSDILRRLKPALMMAICSHLHERGKAPGSLALLRRWLNLSPDFGFESPFPSASHDQAQIAMLAAFALALGDSKLASDLDHVIEAPPGTHATSRFADDRLSILRERIREANNQNKK